MIEAFIYVFPENDENPIKMGKLSFPCIPQEGNMLLFDKLSRPIIFAHLNTNKFAVVSTTFKIDEPISVHLFLKPLYHE